MQVSDDSTCNVRFGVRAQSAIEFAGEDLLSIDMIVCKPGSDSEKMVWLLFSFFRCDQIT